jgi:uncharacterized protein
MSKELIYKNQLVKAIEYHYPNAKIYLFGSWATGRNKPNSDIDLALDIGKPIDLYELDRIVTTIDNLDIPNEVDVVDLRRVPEETRSRILQEKIVWKD